MKKVARGYASRKLPFEIYAFRIHHVRNANHGRGR